MEVGKGRRQKAEGRRQKAEGRKQKAEGNRQKAESRSHSRKHPLVDFANGGGVQEILSLKLIN